MDNFKSILGEKQILNCLPSQTDFSELLKKTHTETGLPLKAVWSEIMSSEKASPHSKLNCNWTNSTALHS